MPSREHLRRFHFIREIASGGFGSVFLTKVMHADGFSRLVAVKLLKSQWSDSEEVARRMRDEARLLGLLRHRNIVDVIDLTSIDSRAAVIMEYLEAVDLRTVVQELAAKGLRLPVRAGLDIVSASASALDAAYNRPPIPGDKPLRVIHRDIKPSNIMVDDTGMVKVLDFGVARSEIENRESHTQELQFGSVDYMAPERLFFEPETPASDVYSLAATLFEVLALEKFGKARGRPARHAAYVTDRLSFLRGGLAASGTVASDLEALIADGLAFNHEDRPTAAEFHQRARALARKVDGDDLSSWAESFLPPLVKAAQDAPKIDNPLTDQIMVEDAKVFGGATGQPSAPTVGAADVLRQGALAEMEDTGAFVPSPPTGAPAQLRARAEIEPDPADAWDDGPTAVGGLTGPVRVPRPDNAEEARRAVNARPGKRGAPPPDLPDPADPFAQLIRSPLSPKPEPPARSQPAEAPADSPTEVADPMRAVEVPTVRPGGHGGYYDPKAPEASGPIPPLPAPPGVSARPLEPVLPAPVVPAPVVPAHTAEAPDEDDDKTVPVVVPPQHRAQLARRSQAKVEAAPEVAAPPSIPPPRSSDTIVPFEEDGEEEVTEMVGGIPQAAVPAQLSPGQPDTGGIPVYGPTDAALGAPHGASPAPSVSPPPPTLPVAAASTPAPVEPVAKPAAPASPPAPVLPVQEPTAAAPEPPSLDDVVPQSADSRYAIELAAAEAESEKTEPSVAPIAPVEAVVEPDSAVAPQDDGPYLDVVKDPIVDEPAPAKKSKAPLFAAAGCFVFFILGGGGIAAAWTMGLGDKLAALSGGEVDAPVVADVEGGSGAAELAGAADTGGSGAPTEAVPDGMVRFRVGLDGVRKLKVDCGGVKASGAGEVSVEHGFEGDCAITAILADRSRKTTRVPAPEPGSYLCFSAGSDACEAE